MNWTIQQEADGWFQVYANGVKMNRYATRAEAEAFVAQQQNPATPSSGGGLMGGDLREQYNKAVAAGDTATANALLALLNAGGGNGASTTSGGGNWGGLWGSLTESNQMQFDEQKRQFEANLSWLKEQYYASQGWEKERFAKEYELELARFGEFQRQYERSLYANTATSMAATAAQLRGPEDWLSYANYTNAGKDIFQSLFGNQASPAFSAPSGYSQPASLQSILSALGITTIPGQQLTPTPSPYTPGGTGAGTGTGAGGQFNTGNGLRTIQQMRDELKAAGYPNWQSDSDDAIKKAYGDTTKKPVTPVAAGAATQMAGAGVPQAQTQAQAGAQTMGAQTQPYPYAGQMPTPQPAPNPYGWDGPGGENPASKGSAVPVGPWRTGTGPTDVQAPLPHQINPMVWDSLSDTAKKMILAAAEGGKTPTGAWSATDYLAQMYAARPKGTAPTSTPVKWGSQNYW